MAKREFIDKNEILDKAQDYGEGQNKLILIDPCYVRNAKPITEQEIVKPIDVPKGATNGDMIKVMFPNDLWLHIHARRVKEDWWNAPFRKVEE